MTTKNPLAAIALSALLLAACNGATENDVAMEADAAQNNDALMEEDTALENDDSAMEAEAFSRTEVTMDDDRSTLTFVGQSNIINHEGEFQEFDVEITLDEESPSDFTQAQLSATIIADSVDSDPGVTAHMKRDDFFDVENHPTITFQSTEITAVDADAGTYQITGDMTVKGTTETVIFDAELTNDMLVATTDFPRRTFQVGNDSYGDKLLNENVPVEVTVYFQ